MTDPFSLGMGDTDASDSAPAYDWRGGALVFASALLLYAVSMSPVVFWGDSAEFSIKATELELSPIARGYPLHRLLTFLAGKAVGDVAFGANLVSVVFGAVTVALLYEAGRMIGGTTAAGVAAACVTGVAHTFWTYAGIAEVYTLHTAFMAGAFVLLLRAPFEDSPGPLSLGVLLGLSLLHHRLLVFAFPGLGLWLLAAAPPGERLRWVGRSALGFALGALPFALLCIFNSRAPPAGVEPTVSWWFRDIFMGGDDNAGFLLGEGQKTAAESAFYLAKWIGFNLTPISALLAGVGLFVVPRLLGMRIAVALWVLFASHFLFPFRYDWTGDQYVFLISLYPICSLLVAAAVGHLATWSGNGAARAAAVLTLVAPVALYATLAGTEFGSQRMPGLTRKEASRFFLPVRLGDRAPREWCAERLDALPPGAILHCQWGDGKVYQYLARERGLFTYERRDRKDRTGAVRKDKEVKDLLKIEMWYGDEIPFDHESSAGRPQYVSVPPLNRDLPAAVAAVKDRLKHHAYLKWEQFEAWQRNEAHKKGEEYKPSPPPVPPLHGLYLYLPPRQRK